MSEPIYEFVKGQGWVINPYKTLSANIGLYEVTLMERQPSPGEYYFEETTPLVDTMNNLKAYWQVQFKGHPNLPVYRVGHVKSARTHYVTVTLRRL